MTQLLERAFAEASKLPEKEQDTFAAFLLKEMASERRWDQDFAASSEKLFVMSRTALQEFAEGETQPLDPDRDFTRQ